MRLEAGGHGRGRSGGRTAPTTTCAISGCPRHGPTRAQPPRQRTVSRAVGKFGPPRPTSVPRPVSHGPAGRGWRVTRVPSRHAAARDRSGLCAARSRDRSSRACRPPRGGGGGDRRRRYRRRPRGPRAPRRAPVPSSSVCTGPRCWTWSKRFPRSVAASSTATRSRRPVRGVRPSAAAGAGLAATEALARRRSGRRLPRRAPARPPRHRSDPDGLLPPEQRRRDRGHARGRGRAGLRRRLRRPPRQRHPGHLLDRPERAVRVAARVAALSRDRAARRHRRRRRSRDDVQRPAPRGCDRRRLPAGVRRGRSTRSSTGSRRRGCSSRPGSTPTGPIP